VEECYACAQACTACADACVGEAQVSSLVQCIRACMDCADICAMAGAVATRRSGSNEVLIRQALGLCEAACRICAEECERHAGHHAHCRICAEACRACERACRDAGQSIH
jgi:hypothetical protein